MDTRHEVEARDDRAGRSARRERRRSRGADRITDRNERRAAKREEMIQAAIKIVRREGADVSMEAIATACGVSKPIVYRAFGDREGLTRAVAERFANELTTKIGDSISESSSDRERVSGAIDAYLSFIEAEPEILRFLVRNAIGEGPVSSGFVDQLATVITEAIGEALRARGLDSGAAEPWAFAIVGAVHLAGERWTERRVMPRARLVEYLTALIYDGMGGFNEPPANTRPRERGRDDTR